MPPPQLKVVRVSHKAFLVALKLRLVLASSCRCRLPPTQSRPLSSAVRATTLLPMSDFPSPLFYSLTPTRAMRGSRVSSRRLKGAVRPRARTSPPQMCAPFLIKSIFVSLFADLMQSLSPTMPKSRSRSRLSTNLGDDTPVDPLEDIANKPTELQ